ncbi:TadE/TadG family type IV pilus assembly protein [Parvularcula marina]|uniref:TadE/TadG family protein n=1 Tax=Parvularcula marina TaxID=2292771 RepID=A0A371R7N3_9PROT|nr:TadE/TadG family type IV pilus assembly protein [Parvularcula marina]RFB01470.1 TadE/TadG family protein [Parvularcula marina]
MWRSFWQNRKGNVALMTAILVMPVTLVLGAGVDFARYVTLRTELDSVVESAVLAAASLTQTRDTDPVVTEFVQRQINRRNFDSDISVEVLQDTASLTNKTIQVRATGSANTYFLSLIGIKELKVTSVATAMQAADNLEISLVLDVSGSMRGSKIDNLHDAASEFVDAIYAASDPDTTSMNIVPFSASVNIAPIFDDYAYNWSSANVDPDPDEYLQYGGVPFGNFRFNSPNNSDCIELQNNDFDSLDLLPYRARPEVRIRPDRSTRYCVTTSASEIYMNRKSPTALKNKIQNLSADGYTAINEGAYWGAVALSPDWKGKFGGDFADRPADYDVGSFKVLIIMTDGEMNQGVRPASYWDTRRGDCIDYETYYDRRGRRRTRCVEYEYYTVEEYYSWDQNIRNNGRASDSTTTNSAHGQLQRICNAAKEEGIVIYTIGFDITPGADSDEALEACASSPTNYYLVEGLDVTAAFRAIAASVNALRITG